MTGRPKMLKDYGDTNFVTGLRAFAAIAVVLIHSGGAGLRQLGPVGNQVADLGAAGVYVFFVISGFSVAASYSAAPSFGHYFARRLLRIAPLYYFWLAAAAATLGVGYWGKHLGAPLDAYNWVMHLTFLSFLDYRVTNSILGVEWSISIEVFWYMVLPALFRLIVHRRHGVAIALAAGAAMYVACLQIQKVLPLPPQDAGLAMHWSPAPYLLSYCLGIVAYKLRRPAPDWIIAAILLLATAYALRPVGDPYLFVSVATFALLCTGSSRSAVCKIFDNRVAVYLGVISYGIYLCHLPLLQLLQMAPGSLATFLILVAASVAASSVTYFAIERPIHGLRLGAMMKKPPATFPPRGV